MTERVTMLQIERDLVASLEEARGDILDQPYPVDMLHEYVDNAVPIYNATLLQAAADSPSLALDEPELGPAFDGSATPINVIAANIYEALYAVAVEWLEEALDAEEVEA